LGSKLLSEYVRCWGRVSVSRPVEPFDGRVQLRGSYLQLGVNRGLHGRQDVTGDRRVGIAAFDRTLDALLRVINHVAV